ncbi:MAG: radical SAM protein [Betaproteobacteria bacterium]|nr:radical SAM protein [Betaproteobacteria bacterium]
MFCASEAIKTTRVIMKSPKRVVEEMKDIATRFPYITHLYIVDDVLTYWPEHITEICDRMDAEGLKFTFESSTRANMVTDELIKRLAKSGLIRLSFGLETIDPVMRVTMGKKVPIDAYPEANRICANHGVEAMNSLMIGLPGETRSTICSTLKWVQQQRDIKQANLAIAIPYPGTEFHDMAVRGDYGLKLLSEDFSKYMRYGSAVTNVGGLSAQDLIDLQNDGFVMIYSQPWRWLPVWKKHGTFGFLLQMYRVLKMWWKRASSLAGMSRKMLNG